MLTALLQEEVVNIYSDTGEIICTGHIYQVGMDYIAIGMGEVWDTLIPISKIMMVSIKK